MGQDGMADMGEMGMKNPRNSIPMMGGPGPFDYITMGGMFTIFKVREDLASYEDPGWYEHPPGTVATVASPDELRRDGINVEGAKEAALRNRYSADAWCGVPSLSSALLAQNPVTVRIKLP